MIARKNTRRVSVDGQPFRYKVSLAPKRKGISHLNITVVSEDHNGSKLLIKGLIQKNYAVLLEKFESRFYAEITQHEMRWLISEAISREWDYALGGADLTLTVTNDIFEPGFFGNTLLQTKVREVITKVTHANRKSEQDVPPKSDRAGG